MLAEHLYRLSRVRYAAMPPQTPPEHAEAMRNFLALHTRAYDLPHLAHRGAEHLNHPLVQQLLHAVLHEHDPHALGPLLDVAQEETEAGRDLFPGLTAMGHNISPLFAHHAVLDNLAALFHLAHGTGHDVRGDATALRGVLSPAEIHRRYATGALRGLPLPPLGNQGGGLRMGDLSWLAALVPPPGQAVVQQADRIGAQEPLTYVPAYDVAHLMSDSTGRMIRERIARALRSSVIPHLHQGLS